MLIVPVVMVAFGALVGIIPAAKAYGTDVAKILPRKVNMKLILLTLLITLSLGCQKEHAHDHDHDHDHDHGHGHGHTHDAPNGGVLVDVENEFCHLEFLVDPLNGRLQMHAMRFHPVKSL